MNIDDSKRAIRRHLSNGKTVQTPMGDLTIVRQLGEGANSIVFESNTSRSKPLALKVLAEDCSIEATQRYNRFLTELREIVQLSDTGLVASVYSWGFIEIETGRFPYAVQKQYSQTMKQWRRNRPIGSLDELVPIVQNLVDCLAAIHQLNIVHRDLKPENLFITNEGHIVLADFGIAWFDPDHYDRLALTSPSERLANYAFSAPEQFEKNKRPAQTMDIFALGQLIQWLVTGETHRGVGRRMLSSVDPSFAPIDPIVDMLLQQDPKNRPQTIGDVRNLVDDALMPSEVSTDDTIWSGLEQFDHMLVRHFPGKRGLIEIHDDAKISSLLTDLSIEASKYQIWMVRGRETIEVRKMRSLENGVWLIETLECAVKAMWVNKFPSLYHRQYILMECAAMPSFGFYPQSYSWEDAAWFEDRYITKPEYDDGYAEINGQSIQLNERAEPRVRETERRFWFLGPAGSNISFYQNDSIVEQVNERLLEAEQMDEVLLEPLEKLNIHPSVLMWL